MKQGGPSWLRPWGILGGVLLWAVVLVPQVHAKGRQAQWRPSHGQGWQEWQEAPGGQQQGQEGQSAAPPEPSRSAPPPQGHYPQTPPAGNGAYPPYPPSPGPYGQPPQDEYGPGGPYGAPPPQTSPPSPAPPTPAYPSYPQPPQPSPFAPGVYDPPGYHQHDGFYLRLNLGLGYMRADTEGSDLGIDGGAWGLAVALGGAVQENLIVFVDFFLESAPGPRLREGNSYYAASDDVSATLVGVGLGLAYYLPSNTYVAGTLATTKLDLNVDTIDGTYTVGGTDWGAGLKLMLGHEWWVSANWGLGLAGQVLLASMRDRDLAGYTTDWRVASFSLLLSATYN